MASDYTGDPDEFYETIALMTGSDPRTVQSIRPILERLLDNNAFLRLQQESVALRQAATFRTTDAVFADTTTNAFAATCLFAVENCAGPVLAIKTTESKAVYDSPFTEAYAGGAIPSLTSTASAAVSAAGRIVVVGATSPFCAFKIPGGSWTGGGSQIGGTARAVVYSPAYNGFLALNAANANIYRSTDATSWASVASGLAGIVQSLAVVGAGGGIGTIVALGSAATPTVRISTNNGASYSAGGALPYAASAQEAGSVAGCPVVTRGGLNGYVYHAARCNSGTEIRLARSGDGVSWEAGPILTAPTFLTFAGEPTLRICQSTGLMLLHVPATLTSDAFSIDLLYCSLDYSRWSTPSQQDSKGGLFYAAAGGRVLISPDSAALYASDAVVNGVLS
jgi:hypothetical protein